MRRGWRALAVLATAAIGVGTAAGCGILPRSTHSDEEVLTDEVTSVRMNGDDGDITIVGDAATEQVTVRRTLKYRGDLPEEPTYRVEDGVLVLDGCDRFCTAHYEVDVPADLPVTGGTKNGNLVLAQVGEVDVKTSNGDASIESVIGPVAAQTSNGDLEITLDSPMDVTVQAKNGDITVTVPDAIYHVTTRTRNGDTNVDLADDPDGEHHLDLSTSNGDITVRVS